jgi:hypothetical protein
LGSLAATVPVILALSAAISTLSCEDRMGLAIGDVDVEIDAAPVERTKTNKYSLEQTLLCHQNKFSFLSRFMQHALQILKNKLQSVLFDFLDAESSKDQDFTQNLKIKDLCLLYLAPSCCHRLS